MSSTDQQALALDDIMKRMMECGREFLDFSNEAGSAVATIVLNDTGMHEGCRRIMDECYAGITDLKQTSDETHKQAVAHLESFIRPRMWNSLDRNESIPYSALLRLVIGHVSWGFAADVIRRHFLRQTFGH